MSNAKRSRASKSITNDPGSSSLNSDSTQETAKRSAKAATTKNPPPWLRKDRTVEEGKLKEQHNERIPDERKARKTAEEGKEKEVLTERAYRRAVDELKKPGMTYSKAYGRPKA